MGTDFFISFYSNGSGDMAICEVKMTLQGHFMRKYYHHKKSDSDYYGIWTDETHWTGNSELERWGPMRIQYPIQQNKLKIGEVQIEFCVSDCTENAKYMSQNLNNNFYLMENGFNTTLKLQEDFKFCCST